MFSGVIYNVKVKDVQSMFFDRVFTKTQRAKKRALERAAAYIRNAARHSIKPAQKHTKKAQKQFSRDKRGEAYSRPGQPPLSKTGLLRQFLYYAYDPDTGGFVVGPAKINRTLGAPKALEHGGPYLAMQRTGLGKWRVGTQRMEARPYMRPALLKAINAKKIDQEIKKALIEYVGRTTGNSLRWER